MGNIGRRKFIQIGAAGAAGGIAVHGLARPLQRVTGHVGGNIDSYFVELVQGFLQNAVKTSDSFAVCDFAGGTLLKSCIARSGKTYVSVARMMPALAAWTVGKRKPTAFQVGDKSLDVMSVLRSAFTNAFDPSHPDYWDEPPSDKPTQRSVEAALVGWSLFLLGDDFLSTLTSQQRANIQRWLASCTQVPERDNNHAWFSAMNQASRLALSKRWKEFEGSEKWMLDDVKSMDALASDGDGWYSDSPTVSTHDYYNFWTFASHFLYWNRIIGKSYPQWSARLSGRVRQFLEKTPYFFAANGGHVLFGRSLTYRWSVLMPLVEGYAQGLWPHSAGLLRGIVRRNLDYHWKMGTYDKANGKLRETLTAGGSPSIREVYIDNGHPYWCMQAFSLYLIPQQDPFWKAREEPLPVERANFRIPFEGPRMMLVGTKRSGQVRFLHAKNEPRNQRYRDKYNKFVFSSHFPFNALTEASRAAWDQTLVFRDTKTGAVAGRMGVIRGELKTDGVETEWWTQLDDLRFTVTSRIIVEGEFEKRIHQIDAPARALSRSIEILEGSATLGLAEGEKYEVKSEENAQLIRSQQSGYMIASWNVDGYDGLEVTETFDKAITDSANIVYPRMALNTLRKPLTAERMTLTSLHYSSPRPVSMKELVRLASAQISSKQS